MLWVVSINLAPKKLNFNLIILHYHKINNNAFGIDICVKDYVSILKKLEIFVNL